LVAAAAYVVLLAILLPWLGAQGAAIAAIICSLLIFVQFALATATVLRRIGGEPIIDESDPTEPAARR
jgi:hypothetical protein